MSRPFQPGVAPCSISICHQLSAFASSTSSGGISPSLSNLPVRTSSQIRVSYFFALGW